MKWWRRFWRLRKQDDRIKIILIFVLAGFIFSADAVHGGIQIYAMVKSPVEYIVRSGETSGITLYQMSGIEAMENVQAVSKQRTSSLTLSDSWGELTVPCLELSDTYLDLAYGISETSAMKIIYMNAMAWNQLMQASGEHENNYEQKIDYALNGEEETGTARIVCLESGLPNDTPYAFCSADNVRLSGGDTAVRVRLSVRDLDGMNIKRLSQLGLEVVNSGDVQTAAMQQEMKFMQIKYDGIALVLCLAAAVSLKKYGRKASEK